MSENHVISLYKRGHTIGGHTHKHDALDSLETSEIKSDVVLGRDKLLEILGFKPNVFSYPHGRYNKSILEVVEKAGFTYGVTTERRGLNSKENPVAVPRFDATDLII